MHGLHAFKSFSPCRQQTLWGLSSPMHQSCLPPCKQSKAMAPPPEPPVCLCPLQGLFSPYVWQQNFPKYYRKQDLGGSCTGTSRELSLVYVHKTPLRRLLFNCFCCVGEFIMLISVCICFQFNALFPLHQYQIYAIGCFWWALLY